MGKHKYIAIQGLAFAEEKTMNRLSKYASKGWITDQFSGFGFRLTRGEPQQLDYSLDYQSQPDEDYFNMFQAAGWTHVCSAGEEIHIFSAPKGTKPIYSDQATLIEKYRQEQHKTGRLAVGSLIFTLAFFLLHLAVENELLPTFAYYLTVPLGLLSLVALVFTGMPYFAYRRKVRKLINR